MGGFWKQAEQGRGGPSASMIANGDHTGLYRDSMGDYAGLHKDSIGII